MTKEQHIDEELFETDEEKLDSLFDLKPQIDSFFDNVMVSADDKNVKLNRQNLIASIYKEITL